MLPLCKAQRAWGKKKHASQHAVHTRSLRNWFQITPYRIHNYFWRHRCEHIYFRLQSTHPFGCCITSKNTCVWSWLSTCALTSAFKRSLWAFAAALSSRACAPGGIASVRGRENVQRARARYNNRRSGRWLSSLSLRLQAAVCFLTRACC